jgi:tight adherence protein B
MIWLEVVDDLISAIRAGLPIAQAIAQVGVTGPAAARPSCEMAAQHFSLTGNFASAISILRAQACDPIADRVCAALYLAHELGGTRVIELLSVLSQSVRDEEQQRAMLKAKQSWTINGARIAVLAPWVTALLLSLRPSARNAYLSASGIQLLLLCAAVTGVAYFIMWWISRLPKPAELRWRQ